MNKKNLLVGLIVLASVSLLALMNGCGGAAGGGGGGGGGGLTAVEIYATTEASKASVFAKGDNVYVVFTTNTSRKLIFAKSTDEGVTFSVVTEEVVGVTDEGFCRMVVTDDDTLYTAYSKYGSFPLIGLSTIDAVAGAHFDNLSIAGSLLRAWGLDMSFNDDSPKVAFNDIADAANHRIRISHPSDYDTLGTLNYKTRQYGGIAYKMISALTNEVVLVNNDESGLTGEVICATTSSDLSIFSTAVVTSSAAGIFDTMDMDIATAEGVMHVCYVLNNKLYCAHSPDLGTLWMPAVLVSDTALANTFSSLVCANGKVYIMFLKDSTTVCLAVSSDGGDTWAVSTLATIASAAYYPEMFVDGTKAYLVYRTSTGVYLLKTTI